MWLEAVAVFACLFFLPKALKWLLAIRRTHSFLSKLPGPPGLPLLGNVLQFGKDSFDTGKFIVEEANRQRALGNSVMRLWIGPRSMVIPLNGEALKPILDSNEELTKGVDYDFILPWLGDGLLISTGHKWKSRRRMLTPTFHFAMLDGYVEKMDLHSKILVDILDDNVGHEIELYQFVKRCALDIICDTAMGCDLDSQHDPNHPYVLAVGEYNTMSRDYSLKPWLWFPPVWYLFYHWRYTQLLATLTGFTKKVIAERIQSIGSGEAAFSEEHGKRKAFLDMLIEMREQNALTEEDIREEVDTFMFEGHDTTSSGIAWTLWCLATNPEVQEKAYQEVHSVFGSSDRSITVDDLKNMPYLERVIKETLRIFPAVPMVERNVQNDFSIGKHVVPAKTDIMIMPIVIHHNDKVYPSHWSFDPDNFLPDRLSSRHAYDFIPFSAGPRNCIGQKFALYEEKLMVAAILRRFSLSSRYSMLDNLYGPETVLRPSLGVPVTLTRRA